MRARAHSTNTLLAFDFPIEVSSYKLHFSLLSFPHLWTDYFNAIKPDRDAVEIPFQLYMLNIKGLLNFGQMSKCTQNDSTVHKQHIHNIFTPTEQCVQIKTFNRHHRKLNEHSKTTACV